MVAQELLLILEDHWSRSPDLHSVPIFSASGLASQSLKVYQTYIEMMNDAIKQAFQVSLESLHSAPAPASGAESLALFLQPSFGSLRSHVARKCSKFYKKGAEIEYLQLRYECENPHSI